jgi:hypothetical protein
MINIIMYSPPMKVSSLDPTTYWYTPPWPP